MKDLSGYVDDPEASERERFEMYLERAKKCGCGNRWQRSRGDSGRPDYL
mgnify:CR=1 FL=1